MNMTELERLNDETKDETYMAIFEYTEGWYRPDRRHFPVRYRSPVHFVTASRKLLAANR